MIRDDSTDNYRCTVERPDHKSYLFFTQFEMTLTGKTLTSYGIYSQADLALPPNEYSLDFSNGSIQHVEGLFSSQLTKLQLQGGTRHREL